MKRETIAVENDSNKSDRPECFAWLSEKTCNALVTKNCRKCSFYKESKNVNNYKKYLDMGLLKGTK